MPKVRTVDDLPDEVYKRFWSPGSYFNSGCWADGGVEPGKMSETRKAAQAIFERNQEET